MTQESLLVFRIANLHYAIPAIRVQEVVHVAATMPVPGQPSILDGFLNFHGRAIAVLLLSRLFGAPSEQNLYASIVIVRAKGETDGWLVEEVEGVVEVHPSELKAIPQDHSFNNCAEAQFAWQDRQVTVLSCDRILLEKERACIAELAGQAQRRLEALIEGRPE